MATNVRYPPNAQIFDIPLVGDDIQKIGRVIDLYANPCKPVAEIWVHAFFLALPTLLITTFKPELIDIDIKHRRGKPRKGRRLRFIAGAVFRDQIISLPVPRWVVFRIFEWSQRIGWYFLIADATEQFAINWMSMAYIYNGCPFPQACYAYMSGNHVLTGSGLPPWPRPTLLAATQSSNFEFPSGFARPALNGVFRATWDITFEPYQIPGQSETPFATCLLVNGQPWGDNEVISGGGGTKRSIGNLIVETNAAPHPQIAIGAYWNTANKFCYRTGHLDITRTSDFDLAADP